MAFPMRRPAGRWVCRSPGLAGGPDTPGRRHLFARAKRRRRLKAELRRLFEAHGGKRGSPVITADLREAGWRVSENAVAELMREQHLAARGKKACKGVTRQGKGRRRVPDLVKRDFTDGVIFHAGQGSEYTRRALPGSLRADEHPPVHRTPRLSLGNALIESWHSTLEFELLGGTIHYQGASAGPSPGGIEDYNQRRLRSSLKMISPIDPRHALLHGRGCRYLH